VTANDYGPGDSASIVLAICRYHRNSNGWNDIGYNFLVDKYGTIFEGRAGGIDQPVIGAQAQGWNTASTGIANLGTYDTTPASAAAMQAMAGLLAWKLPLSGAAVAGQVTVTSRGGADNRYPSGTPVTFERISGHRDGDRTDCPGDALYAQLPQLREMAAGHAAPAPQLVIATLRRRLRYPATVPLRGRLTQFDGSGLGGAPIEVQMLGKSGFRPVASAVTAPDGGWSASVPIGTSRTFRAVFAGDASHAAVTSVQLAVIVQPVLSARVRTRRVLAGHRTVVSGSVRPRKPSLHLRVELRGGHGRYRIVSEHRVRVRAGTFRVPIRLTRAALYRLRAVFPGDVSNAPAESAALYVRAVRGLTAARARP
jgi:hypothetical protein